MSYLYVSEQGATIAIEANRFKVLCKNDLVRSIPAESLELIEVFGKVQKSAFEALIDESLFIKLQRTIPTLIKEDEDSVRIYRMTGYGEVKLFGTNTKIAPEEVMII